MRGANESTAAPGGRERHSGPSAGERFASINPATGEVLGYVTAAGPGEVEAAVLAARKAQPAWGAMTGTERGRVRRIAVVALARKLLIALWRYVTHGEVPEGAV